MTSRGVRRFIARTATLYAELRCPRDIAPDFTPEEPLPCAPLLPRIGKANAGSDVRLLLSP